MGEAEVGVSDRFSSARSKLKRAKCHIEDLAGRVQAFEQSNPYVGTLHTDSDRVHKFTHKLQLKIPFPEGLSEIAGDAVNNLREALDHLAYAAAGRTAYTYFPFDKTKGKFEAAKAGRAKPFPPRIFDLFCSFKPYQGDDGDAVLYSLNALANRNKHGSLLKTGIAAEKTHQQVLSSSGQGATVEFPDPLWRGESHDLIVAVTDDPHLKFNCTFRFSVSFFDVDHIEGRDAVEVLMYIAGRVEEIISATDALADQLGIL